MSHEIIRKAVSFRNRRRFQEALHQLEDLAHDTSFQVEKALIYVLQCRYDELLQLLPETPLDGLRSESKGESLNRMIRSFTQIHKDLRLREATLSSEAVAGRWLTNHENLGYDRLDVYMISLYAIIQYLGEAFTNTELDEPQTESPSKIMLHTLCSHLLQSYRFEELLWVQMLVQIYPIPEIISNFQGTLVHILSYLAKTESVCEDFQAHIRLLLYETCLSGNEQDKSAYTELQKLQEIFDRTGNANATAWVQLHIILLCGEAKSYETGPFEEILDKFKSLNDWRGVQVCSFAIAKIYRNEQELKTYTSTLLSLLKPKEEADNELFIYESSTKPQINMPSVVKQLIGHGLAKPITEESGKRRRGTIHQGNTKRQKVKETTRYQDLANRPLTLTSKDLGRRNIGDTYCFMNHRQSVLRGNGSMFNFWQSYLALLEDDLRDNRRIGSVIAICSQFFEEHPECSIPQLQFLLAITISESYGKFGHVTMVMRWAARALGFAKAADNKELIAEAESHLEDRLASHAVAPEDDPTGMKLREKVTSKMVDLEILYEAAGTHGHFMRQYEYAQNLLDMQLSAEIKSKISPIGEPWLSRTRGVTDKLPNGPKEKARSCIDFAVAHAKFEFGEYHTAIGLLNKIVDSSGKAGNDKLRSHALFTKGRAYLQLYLDSNDETAWGDSHRNLQESSKVSTELGRLDHVACCHTVLAALWWAKVPETPNAGPEALRHIEGAAEIWSEEIKNLDVLSGPNGMITKYSLRHRGLDNLYDIFGIAFSICFEISDFNTAWEWAQRAKARAFCDSLHSIKAPFSNPAIHQPYLPEAESEKGTVFVHWVTAGEMIYMLTCRPGKYPQMFPLDIKFSTVVQWYSDLIDAQDDLSDAESAEETLMELNSLIEPLGRDEVSVPGDLLVLCPTKLLFKIPLHALFVGDQVLLSRNPILYTHVISPLRLRQQHLMDPTKQRTNRDSQIALFGNPTGDIASGEESVNALGKRLGGRVFVKKEATKQAFMDLCLNSRLVHYHGHVITNSRAIRNSMIFHEGAQLHAREVFCLDLHRLSPLICLIGCGSGTQTLQPGDEPLGFIPAFLYAGASAIVATLWPIHDSLSGAAFTKFFYEGLAEETGGDRKPVDLALSLQKAALAIRSREETRAPYFWAGFILYGNGVFSYSS